MSLLPVPHGDFVSLKIISPNVRNTLHGCYIIETYILCFMIPTALEKRPDRKPFLDLQPSLVPVP